MRRVLISEARRRKTEKRGDGVIHSTFNEDLDAGFSMENLLNINDSLEALAQVDPVAAQLVELRFFGGFEVVQVAEILDVSERTVKRKWHFARTWLFKRIKER